MKLAGIVALQLMASSCYSCKMSPVSISRMLLGGEEKFRTFRRASLVNVNIVNMNHDSGNVFRLGKIQGIPCSWLPATYVG